MRKFMTWFVIICKSILKNPLLIALLVLIPVSAAVLTTFSNEGDESAYIAGIYLDEDNEDEIALALSDRLIDMDSVIQFISYSNLDDMYRDVSAQKISCGYIFPKELSSMGIDKGYKDYIFVIHQAGNSTQHAINELVYSQLIRLQGYTIIKDYMVEENIFEETDAEAIDELYELYEGFLDGSETFRVIIETYGVSGLNETKEVTTTIAFPIRGVLAILVFLAGLCGGVLWLGNKERGVFEALSLHYKLLCHILYIVIPVLLFAVSVLITLAITGDFIAVPLELLSMLLLVVIVTVFCYVFTLLIKNSRTLTACIPVIMLGCLIFCPVFINVTSYIPAASFIEKLFMPYYYLSLFN